MTKKYILSMALFASILNFSSIQLAQGVEIENEKRVLILELMNTLGVNQLMEQMKVQMFSLFKQSEPYTPPEVWKELEAKFNMDELIEKMIPLYNKYYSEEDLVGILEFYKSPIGQRVLATLPQVTAESMAIGQEWGSQKSAELKRELEERRLLSEKSYS